MTRDTVAGESPRCSARNFRLTDGAEAFPRGRDDVTVFDRGIGVYGARSLAHQACSNKRQMRDFSHFSRLRVKFKIHTNAKKIGLLQDSSSTVNCGLFPTFLLTRPLSRVSHARQGQ